MLSLSALSRKKFPIDYCEIKILRKLINSVHVHDGLTTADVRNIIIFSHTINQSINQSWIYIAHKRKASNALVR